jgi:heme exporter protein A
VSSRAVVQDLPAQSSDDAIDLRIRARKLTKRYGLRTVLRSLDLDVPNGQSVVLFGPNGAGKTTLLRILSTLSRPAGGTVEINGFDAEHDANEIRAQIGVLAHQPYVYDSLTGRENLQFFGRMFDIPEAQARIEEVLSVVELSERADDRVGTYSRGMLQRIALARAILHRPSLLLLDEPDTGLDPASVKLLERVLRAHVEAGGSTMMTTHDLGFGLRSSDRVLVLVGGKIALDEPCSSIEAQRIEVMMGAPGA